MHILLSEPDAYFDKRVEAAAQQAGCYARVKWSAPRECRFVLVEQALSMTPATFAQHDDVIARLFMEDPHAKVRTAKATFNGAAEFYQAKQGRVA